jgi:hypothetical protein
MHLQPFFILATLLALAPAGPAIAQQAAQQPLPPPSQAEGEPLSGDELRALVTGNTVSGHHDSGMPYSEYHSPDGRVFGHNNHDPVKDGCWRVRGDSICYSYESGKAPGLFCWRFYHAKDGNYRILLPATGTTGSAIVAKGNPEHHTDHGKPWTCQALLSMR